MWPLLGPQPIALFGNQISFSVCNAPDFTNTSSGDVRSQLQNLGPLGPEHPPKKYPIELCKHFVSYANKNGKVEISRRHVLDALGVPAVASSSSSSSSSSSGGSDSDASSSSSDSDSDAKTSCTSGKNIQQKDGATQKHWPRRKRMDYVRCFDYREIDTR